jgi:nucleoside-diphosphate-sugar epimerase
VSESLRIAVTGGSGGIGRFVVRHLLDRGHRIVNLDRRRGDDSRAQFARCDVRNHKKVAAVLTNCDALCHLAEIPNIHTGVPSDEVYWSNARAGSVVFQIAADRGLRHAVYASSCQVYGSWGEVTVPPVQFPIDESHPVRPMNAYAASKAANELFAKSLCAKNAASISIFRFPWALTNEFDEKAMRFFEQDDAPLRDGFNTFIHAGDLASAFAAALETARPGCEIYNLSAPDILSVFPLRQRLEKYHPEYPRLPADWPDFKSPLAIDKAQQLLGWTPRWSFLEHFHAARPRPLSQLR